MRRISGGQKPLQNYFQTPSKVVDLRVNPLVVAIANSTCFTVADFFLRKIILSFRLLSFRDRGEKQAQLQMRHLRGDILRLGNRRRPLQRHAPSALEGSSLSTRRTR